MRLKVKHGPQAQHDIQNLHIYMHPSPRNRCAKSQTQSCDM
jgi:hypothetical protein